MSKPDANGWRYTPGLWYRTDGARVERVTSGDRKGEWRAMLPGSTFSNPVTVLSDGTVGGQYDKLQLGITWQSYKVAGVAKTVLDDIRRESDLNTARLIREAFKNSADKPLKTKNGGASAV